MACQRCGSTIPADARACPTCGLATSPEVKAGDSGYGGDFDSEYPSLTGYVPLYTTLDGAPGNAPAFWLPLPMNVGTDDDPQYSSGIPRERLPTIPLVQNPDGTAPRLPAVVKRPKPPQQPHQRRRVHWLALFFGLLLAGLLLSAYALAVLVGGTSSATGVQVAAVAACMLASVLAGIGVLANGLSRWSARRRDAESSI